MKTNHLLECKAKQSTTSRTVQRRSASGSPRRQRSSVTVLRSYAKSRSSNKISASSIATDEYSTQYAPPRPNNRAARAPAGHCRLNVEVVEHRQHQRDQLPEERHELVLPDGRLRNQRPEVTERDKSTRKSPNSATSAAESRSPR